MRRHVVALALALGCSVTTTEEAQWIEPQWIVGGTLADDEAVVAIVERPLCGEQFTVSCTGTVIAPQVVLTAAHCVPPGAAREVHVGSPVGSGRFIAMTDAVRHPAFDDATHAFDLAIVYLDEPVDLTPVALPAATLDASFVGASVRVVGFGVEASGATTDGTRRAGTMQIESIDASTFVATPAPDNTCGGDSGGPVFVTVGGEPQLLGITVAGDPTCVARATNGRVDIAVADFVRPLVDAPAPPAPPNAPPPCPDPEGSCSAGRATSVWPGLLLVGYMSWRRRRADSTRRADVRAPAA